VVGVCSDSLAFVQYGIQWTWQGGRDAIIPTGHNCNYHIARSLVSVFFFLAVKVCAQVMTMRWG